MGEMRMKDLIKVERRGGTYGGISDKTEALSAL